MIGAARHLKCFIDLLLERESVLIAAERLVHNIHGPDSHRLNHVFIFLGMATDDDDGQVCYFTNFRISFADVAQKRET